MLDDLKMIHERDGSDALGIVEKQASQLAYDFDMPPIDAAGVTNIVYAGMGGSALAALLSGVWPGYQMPFEVVRQYDIPSYVSDKTLFIAASYSGNTEETLSALEQAENQGARIVVIAGGGRLADIAHEKGYPIAVLPKTAQPRYAVLYNLKAVLDIMTAAEILDPADYREELQKGIDFLNASVADWRPDVPTAKNPAKQLAQELMGKSVVMYSGPILAPAAYKWKISFNENAKHIAWINQFPELNHNEFLGWTKQPVDKPYAVIELRSAIEHERIQKRFDVTERLLSGMRPAPHKVEVQGEGRLQQLLWAGAYGDFVTLYLALLNGLNPAPVDLIETFKKALND